MQESGIEKDDLQTMFNVLDSDDSGEVHVLFFVGKSWRKRSGIFVLYIFFVSFFCFCVGLGGKGEELGGGMTMDWFIWFLSSSRGGEGCYLLHTQSGETSNFMFFFQNRLDWRHA